MAQNFTSLPKRSINLSTFIKKGREDINDFTSLGMTKSKKQVYEEPTAKHSVYKNFTPQDHKEAAAMHKQQVDRYTKVGNGPMTDHHTGIMKSHLKRAGV